MNGRLGAGETRVPSVGLATNHHGLDRCGNRARPAQGNTANLGQYQESVIQPCAVAILFVGERVISIGPLEAWESGVLSSRQTPKEILVGTVEAREYILEDMAVNRSVFGKGRTNLLEFCLLLEACGALALSPSPPRDALLQGRVVQHTTLPQDTRKLPLLFGSRRELVFVGFAHSGFVHINLFCLIAGKTVIQPGFWLKPEHASPPG